MAYFLNLKSQSAEVEMCYEDVPSSLQLCCIGGRVTLCNDFLSSRQSVKSLMARIK